MDRGPLDMLVRVVHAGKTDAVLLEKPWPKHAHHVTSENGWAPATMLLQLVATLDNVLNPSRERQSWILLWDMASIHASEATLAAMKVTFPHVVLCFILPRSTSYLQPCDVAIFRSFKSCIASAALARPRWLLRRPGHEQSMAAPVFGRLGISRSHGPLRRE